MVPDPGATVLWCHQNLLEDEDAIIPKQPSRVSSSTQVSLHVKVSVKDIVVVCSLFCYLEAPSQGNLRLMGRLSRWNGELRLPFVTVRRVACRLR